MCVCVCVCVYQYSLPLFIIKVGVLQWVESVQHVKLIFRNVSLPRNGDVINLSCHDIHCIGASTYTTTYIVCIELIWKDSLLVNALYGNEFVRSVGR